MWRPRRAACSASRREALTDEDCVSTRVSVVSDRSKRSTKAIRERAMTRAKPPRACRREDLSKKTGLVSGIIKGSRQKDLCRVLREEKGMGDFSCQGFQAQ